MSTDPSCNRGNPTVTHPSIFTSTWHPCFFSLLFPCLPFLLFPQYVSSISASFPLSPCHTHWCFICFSTADKRQFVLRLIQLIDLLVFFLLRPVSLQTDSSYEGQRIPFSYLALAVAQTQTYLCQHLKCFTLIFLLQSLPILSELYPHGNNQPLAALTSELIFFPATLP